jgi:thiol-disulfide isomerase/thioredoxin/YHS domain-containing protein
MLKSGFHSILVLYGILLWLSPQSIADDSSIRWFDSFEAGVQHATTNQLPLMLHFYGDSCPPCKMLEKRAYKDPQLVDKINKQMVAIKINGDRQRELRERYRITSWPTDVYLTPTGKELYRTTSPQDSAVYAQLVDRVALQCADWNVEQMAARKSEERRIAKRTSTQIMQSGQSSIDPSLTGPAVHPVVTQSRVAGPPPTTKQSPANTKQRRIENPYIAENPLVVPPAQHSLAPVYPAAPNNPVNQQFAAVADQTGRRSEAFPVSVDSANKPQQPTMPNGSGPNPRLPVANRPVPVQPIAATLDAGIAVAANHPPNVAIVNNDIPAATAPTYASEQQREPSAPLAANGLDGFCPVTLVMAVRSKSPDCWVDGKPEFAVKHRGRVYLCASEDARRTFLSAPDEFAPALSNYDLIHFVKTGQLIDGRCEFGSFQPTTGKVFLFANQQNCIEFQQMESHYSEVLHRGMSAERVAEQPSASQLR